MNRSAGHHPGSFQKLEYQPAGAVPGSPIAFKDPMRIRFRRSKLSANLWQERGTRAASVPPFR